MIAQSVYLTTSFKKKHIEMSRNEIAELEETTIITTLKLSVVLSGTTPRSRIVATREHRRGQWAKAAHRRRHR